MCTHCHITLKNMYDVMNITRTYSTQNGINAAFDISNGSAAIQYNTKQISTSKRILLTWWRLLAFSL